MLQEEILKTAQDVANKIISIVFDFTNATWSPDQVVYFPQLEGRKPPERYTAVVDLLGFSVTTPGFFRTIHFEPASFFRRDEDLIKKDDVIYTITVLTPIRLLIYLQLKIRLGNIKTVVNDIGHLSARISLYKPEILVKCKLRSFDYTIQVPISYDVNEMVIPINIVKDVLVPYQTDYRLDGTIGEIKIH